MKFEFRGAVSEDITDLAPIWFEGWRDAHLAHVPAELAQIRSLENFSGRLPALLADTRIGLIDGVIAGFSILAGDEIDHFFLARTARGTGFAAALMQETENFLRQRGHDRAWLACVEGNERAAAFYRKCGWDMTGTMQDVLKTDPPFTLQMQRFEKTLSGRS